MVNDQPSTRSYTGYLPAESAPASALRPLVFIIDRPKTCLLATILAVLALVAVGALANNLLSAPRRLACEVPAAVAPQQ